jgi:hypothetical protein
MVWLVWWIALTGELISKLLSIDYFLGILIALVCILLRYPVLSFLLRKSGVLESSNFPTSGQIINESPFTGIS